MLLYLTKAVVKCYINASLICCYCFFFFLIFKENAMHWIYSLVWLFLPIFLRPLNPRSQEDPELANLHLHRQRSHTENPVPEACIRSWVGTSVTHDSLLSISVLFLCYLNSLHLACPSFTSLYCLKFPPIYKTYLAQAPFPRSNLGWSNLGSSDNFRRLASHNWPLW